jgi:hypothetical protein
MQLLTPAAALQCSRGESEVDSAGRDWRAATRHVPVRQRSQPRAVNSAADCTAPLASRDQENMKKTDFSSKSDLNRYNATPPVSSVCGSLQWNTARAETPNPRKLPSSLQLPPPPAPTKTERRHVCEVGSAHYHMRARQYHIMRGNMAAIISMRIFSRE